MVTEKTIKICGHGSGTPSVKVMYTYNSSRYSQKMANGTRKGVCAVKRLKGLTDAQRVKFHDIYKTILGRNTYSNSLRKYVFEPYTNGKYYSDCSSSVMATLNKATGKSMNLLSTIGIYNSTYFENVPVKIVDGHIQNPEILKVGDCLLYSGNSDRPAPMYIGHVEAVYEIEGGGAQDPERDKSISGKYVTTGRLYLRKKAGITGKAIIVMPKGTRCYNYGYFQKVLGTTWLWVDAYVDSVKYTGWCSSKYLKKE